MPKKSEEEAIDVNEIIANVIKLKCELKDKRQDLKDHRKKIAELEQKLYKL